MKRKLWTLGAICLVMSLAWGFPVAAEPPPLEEQIEQAIVVGLGWLAEAQQADGSWGTGCERVAQTGLAVLKFETRAIELGLDPLDTGYAYESQVAGGLAYIMGNVHPQPIGVEPAGNPDGDGDGLGVYFDDCGGHPIYSTGIAMMALAASGHPESYGDALQDAVDFMAWAQADPECGLHRGGWRYGADQCASDNSNAGYATLGLGYASSAPPWGFGLTVPQFVKDELSIWVDVMQDDVDGDPDDGGSWYEPTWSWVNILKTGNLIYEMGLVGDGAQAPRVLDAVDYIERHWDDAGGCGTGWRDHRQAMFTMMKGFESLGIDAVDVGGDPEYDWFAEVAQHLVDTQQGDGSWPYDCWGDLVLSTVWALLTLEKAVPEFQIEVPVDIKPQSCPNPLNVTSRGVLPAAILGTEDLDVAQIDPASVRLVNLIDPEDPTLHVAPLRWAFEDVATPYEPFVGKEGAYDCYECGPDGYGDLTLKFRSQEVVAAVGDVQDGEVLVLQIIGNLKEEFGGTPILGEDVVLILK